MYSTIVCLLAVRDALTSTPEMEKLLGSSFRGLFQIMARRLLMGRVVHGMMTRQVVLKKKYEMWHVFGGKPLRFSLVEFGEVTGLSFGEFEEGYNIDYQLPQKDKNYDYWERLIGSNRDVTIKDLVAMKKFRLCLLIIVDGVLVATAQKPRLSLKYVKMLEDLKKFLAFPWERDSFMWTISTLKPPPKVMGKCENPTGIFLLYFGHNVHVDTIMCVHDHSKCTCVHDGYAFLCTKSCDVHKYAYIEGTYEGTLGWGDAGDPLYVYSEKEKNKKRKTKCAVVAGEGSILKHKRVSAYFNL
ncbi:hypothetical protein N665_0491s0006 [Sinapis alba]|nr:hypothetical protein N665_0491s0006 [Sinapis alba]